MTDSRCDDSKRMDGWMDELDRIVVMYLTVILLMTITMGDHDESN